MDLVTLCARRLAIVAALVGGFMIAVTGAGLCARGVLWGGTACAAVVRAGLAMVGW